MKALFLRACTVALAAASLAGCASMGGGPAPVEVTRFHLNQPVARGQIAIEAANPAEAGKVEFRTYEAAVARQLSRLGWTVVNTVGQSEQVALIDVEQGTREAIRMRAPMTGGGWGGGPVRVAGPGTSDVVATLLEVRIKRRSDGTVFWEGRATTEARAGTPYSTAGTAIEKLAEALFRDFPGESGRTIRVR